jgi:hypothetical protein
MHGFTPATRHLSAVRALPAFFCTHGALPWPNRQFLTLRERKSMHSYKSYIQTCAYSPATRHLSAVRARPAFFCTRGALPWPDRQFLTLRERKSMFYIYIYNIYISYIQTCAYSPATLYPNCNAIGALLSELYAFEQTAVKRRVTFLYI